MEQLIPPNKRAYEPSYRRDFLDGEYNHDTDIGLDTYEDSDEDETFDWEESANDSIKYWIRRVKRAINDFKKVDPTPKPTPKPAPYAVKQVFGLPWLRKGVLSYMIPNQRQKYQRELAKEYGMPYEFVSKAIDLKNMQMSLQRAYYEMRNKPRNFNDLMDDLEEAMKKLNRLTDTELEDTDHGELEDLGVDITRLDSDDEDYDEDADGYIYRWTKKATVGLRELIEEAQDLYEEYS
jgi:hypothetical protein